MIDKRQFLVIGPVLCCALLLVDGVSPRVGSSALQADEQPPGAPADKISVVIDYGDGVQKHFTAIDWKEGMSVLAAMRVAQSHPRGIRFEYRGERDTAFLTKIDDVANEGIGRNWTYRVNGKAATKSCGVYELVRGDSVLWRFK